MAGTRPSVDDPTELRLLLNLIFRTQGCSERFRGFVLKAVEHSVLTATMPCSASPTAGRARSTRPTSR